LVRKVNILPVISVLMFFLRAQFRLISFVWWPKKILLRNLYLQICCVTKSAIRCSRRGKDLRPGIGHLQFLLKKPACFKPKGLLLLKKSVVQKR
jgi:hypothetical protein